MRLSIAILIVLLFAAPLAAQTRPRGRELGIPFPGQPGPNNGITDVPGIAVGHVTLIWAGNSSGDLFLAFSTANPGAGNSEGTPSLKMLPNDQIDPLFRATIDATEEAVVNAMLAAETMIGADGIKLFGLPGDRVVAALRKYNRMK